VADGGGGDPFFPPSSGDLGSGGGDRIRSPLQSIDLSCHLPRRSDLELGGIGTAPWRRDDLSRDLPAELAAGV
jgi:hypothetical protein